MSKNIKLGLRYLPKGIENECSPKNMHKDG